MILFKFDSTSFELNIIQFKNNFQHDIVYDRMDAFLKISNVQRFK